MHMRFQWYKDGAIDDELLIMTGQASVLAGIAGYNSAQMAWRRTEEDNDRRVRMLVVEIGL